MIRQQLPRKHRSSSGFTLIEVVVSLAILALSLGAIYESLGWSLRRTAVLEQRETAWLAAQSLLAEIRRGPLLQVGAQSGELPKGLRWTSRIAARSSSVDRSSPLQPFDVTIDVAWGNRSSQQVRLQSIEIGRGPR